MDASRLRAGVVVLIAVALSGLGFWLGEAGEPAWTPVPTLIGLLGCITLGVLITGKSFKKISVGVGMLVMYGVAFFLGLSSFNHAFGECVERGDNVRVLLNDYRRAKGAYTQTLAQLGSPIPCDRISRPTILTYQQTENGYDLRFRDWLVEHIASEVDSFMAHK